MHTELTTALLASKLRASESAAAALAHGWRVERLSEPSVVTQMSVTTYTLRAAHVKALDGEHWQQLAASTEELVENLRSAVGTAEECVKISGTEDYYFLVFRSTETGRIHGCLCVRVVGNEALLDPNEPAA